MKAERSLFWMPRILGILFAAFLSIFALDVFGEGYGFWGTIFALVMHLIPTLVVLAVLAVAWRWEALGGILFIALGAWYLIGAWGRFHWSTYLVISGPVFLIGGLFLSHWAYQARVRRSS
jgi:hypothetical protein